MIYVNLVIQTLAGVGAESKTSAQQPYNLMSLNGGWGLGEGYG